MTSSPDAETLYPGISKVEILFPVVSRHCHLSDRVNFSNSGQARRAHLVRFRAETVSSDFTRYPSDPRAGLQTDALSLASARPATTRDSFETSA